MVGLFYMWSRIPRLYICPSPFTTCTSARITFCFGASGHGTPFVLACSSLAVLIGHRKIRTRITCNYWSMRGLLFDGEFDLNFFNSSQEKNLQELASPASCNYFTCRPFASCFLSFTDSFIPPILRNYLGFVSKFYPLMFAQKLWNIVSGWEWTPKPTKC